MIDRIFLNMAARQLGYFDVRSFRRWCRINELMIYRDTGCKKQYVLKEEFEKVTTKSIKDQQDFVNSFINDDKPKIVKMKNLVATYKTKGEHEKRTLARLHKIIGDIACGNG